VKNVELKNAVDGDAWSQVMAVAHKLATGDDINANLVRCDWEDPNTPTYAQLRRDHEAHGLRHPLPREPGTNSAGAKPARTRNANTSPSRSANPMANT
jgi:hypothetical protein